ncbi:MAG: glycosyltransferase [Actinomycetota bacterium]|nr:glycosyltransferase [Actinomycetota bacterium]
MRIVIFCHSLVSDWNHGNAHFLRGIVAELLHRGHDVRVLEPRDGWSRANLVREHGEEALHAVRQAFPWMRPVEYDLATLDLDRALDGADLVLVHEWSDRELVARIGGRRARAGAGFRLLFHDTHHRAVSRPAEMAAFDLRHYDGVLAFGAIVRDLYLERGWTQRAWTWHEAADTRVFTPRKADPDGDLVWIGNWGDDERSEELRAFLLGPARRLRLRGAIHGVRYPRGARVRIRLSGLRYRGWLPNHRVPEAFARHRVTLHVPRRPYVEALPGIPTIRPFEAMACAIPLVCSPWEDAEGLFRPGRDYLVARDGAEATRHVRAILADPELAHALARSGLETIRARHTCAHRVVELERVAAQLAAPAAAAGGRP